MPDSASSPRGRFFEPRGGSTVRVPDAFKPLFDSAEGTVRAYFKDAIADPSKGIIEIADQRYVLFRASALSIDFLETIQQLYADRGETEASAIGRSFLFDIAHSIGMNDARAFHAKMGLTDPIAKLSAGPVHFAYSGWAFVDIHPESAPSPDENFFMFYDHPYSFEADSWLRAGRRSQTPVCIMNAGYSSGWCEQSFGVELTAAEILCRARGDDRCTFIMAPPDRIEQRIQEHMGHNHTVRSSATIDIPSYFERKHMEDALRSSEQRTRSILEAIPLPVFITQGQENTLIYGNAQTSAVFHLELDQLEGRACEQLFQDPDALQDLIRDVQSQAKVHGRELQLRRTDDTVFWALVSGCAIRMPDGGEGTLITTLDITERKRSEAQMRALQNQLLDASRQAGMAEIATGVLHNVGNILNNLNVSVELIEDRLSNSKLPSLSKAFSLLQEHQGQLDAFLGSDVRGQKLMPLMQKLLEHLQTEQDELRSENSFLKERVRHMNTVVSQQQEHAKGVTVIERCSVPQLVDESIALVESSFRKAGVQLTKELPALPEIQTDRHQVLQILVNLLTNACDAVCTAALQTEAGRVEVHAQTLSDERCLIWVQDNGVGIPEAIKDKIFNHGFTTRADGHGFGLHNACNVAKAMGGELSCQSDGPGQGARFTLELPLRVNMSAPKSTQAHKRPQG